MALDAGLDDEPSTVSYVARTAYDIAIPLILGDREEALAWAEPLSTVYERCRIVRVAGGRAVTIWRHQPEPQSQPDPPEAA